MLRTLQPAQTQLPNRTHMRHRHAKDRTGQNNHRRSVCQLDLLKRQCLRSARLAYAAIKQSWPAWAWALVVPTAWSRSPKLHSSLSPPKSKKEFLQGKQCPSDRACGHTRHTIRQAAAMSKGMSLIDMTHMHVIITEPIAWALTPSKLCR